MRYEDASSSFNAAEGTTDARNDEDALAAGSRGPASGNTITGAGTITGLAGADIVANGPGQIVALEGANGSDTADGGSLKVAGRYGDLTMDSRGSYRYEKNDETPDGARDVFRYTLADAAGARDTATLTINIGRDPLKVDANAQQIIPGPDGVVTLPPGVQLSDIHVVGRNLVIDLPDGSQMVIIDGAVFVPQLVLGGVEVPASNLAALLIDSEPQPAAGTPLSSGGNFAVDVPPLDPGVPLGDLIPPTELDYVPPVFEDVGQFIDEEPEIFIQPDGQPASVAAVDIVNEAGLPIRNGGEPAGSGESADGNGADNDDTSETTIGTILIDSPDDPSVVTINGTAVTSVGQVFVGTYGTLTITSISDSAIGYSYTLTDNNLLGDATHDDFSVTVTDNDGDQATATLTINIIDDVPTARNDTDAVPDGADSTDGNVLTGANTTSGSAGSDTPGADDLPNGVTGIHAGTSGSFTAVTGAGVSVAGTFGTLLIHSDGSYTYTISGNQGAGGPDVFTYQIIDGDGDVSTATLTITVPPDFIPQPNNATAIVDDDGLPNGNNDSAPGDDVVPNTDGDNNETTFSGTLTANFGTDGPGTFTLAAMNNQTQVVGQETVRYTWNDATDTLTAVVEGGDRDGLTLFTVELDPNGAFDVTLVNNVLQVDDGTNTENNATAALTFTATDDDGDSTNGTLTITFDDDIPTAIVPPPPPQGEPQEPLLGGFVDEDLLPDGNNDSAPGDDPGGTTASGGAGSLGALFNAGADQPLTFSLSSNTSGLPSLTSNGVPVTYAVVGNVLTASAGGTPVFTLTVNADGSWQFELLDQLDHPTADTEDNLLLDLSSVIVATDDDGDEVTGAPGAFVIDVDDDLPVANDDVNPIVGLVDEDDLPTGNHDDAPGDDDPNNVDGDNDGTTTGGGAPSLVSLFNGGADQPLTILLSADTSGLPALTSNGVPVTYAVVGNVLTASAGGTTVFTLTVNADGTWAFDLQDQLDHSVPGTEDNILIDFSSVITAVDADGDTAELPDDMFVIDVDDDMPQEFEECPDDVIAVNNPGSIFTGDLNLPPVGADEPGVVTFGVEDGDPVLDNEGNPITSEGTPLFYFINDQGVLEARAGDENGDVIFTITINGDGTFTYEQFGPMGSGGETSFEDLTSTSAGNVEFRGVGADDPATTIDLLLSAEAGGADATVNTDSDSIGSANQSMDNGETVRIDFVSDLTTGAATPSGFGYSGHVSTTSFIQLIPQVQGSQSETTALTIWALNTSNTQAAEPDRNPAGGFSDSTITPVTEVTVKDYLTGNSTTVDVTGFTVGVFTAVAYGISARVNADGSVTFSGIQQGDSYGISTGAGEFNAVAVQSEPAGTGGSTQDSFDLGVFSIGTGDVIEPVDLTVPIVLTDADGDPVVCDIDIILGPPVDAPDITVTVNEAGLPVIGSDPVSDSEIQSGDLQGQVTGGTGPYTFTLVGSGDGTFGTLVLNSDGTFTYTLDTPFDTQPDADDGTNPELGAETFTFEAEDQNGSVQTGTITVNIIDDVPSIDVTADPDSGVVLLTQDAETIGGATDTASSTADFSDVFELAFVAGADGAATTPDLSYVLGVSAPGVDSQLNQGGANIYLHLIGGKVVGSTSATSVGVTPANTVFDVSVNADGVVTLTQYSQIDHPLEAGLNDAPFADQVASMADNLITLTASAAITDNDGDTDNDSLTVNIGANLQFADHGPTATNDVDSIAPGFFGTATGNVMTGTEVAVAEDTNPTDGNADNVGADTPGRISQVSFTSDGGGAPVVQAIAPGGSTVIAGDYGVLTLYSNGDYSYDRNDGSAGGVDDVFTYTLTDADGDTVTATLTINIGVNPPVATTASAAVDDDGLANANPAGGNDINANTQPTPDDLDGPASSEASFRGVLGVTGGDGDIDFSLIAPAGQVAVGQEMVTFSFIAGVLTATIATSPDATRVGDPLFTVQLDGESGEYIVTLVDNILHGDDANNDEDGTEVSVNIPYQVVDAGGNSSAANGTLNIVFNDDVPTATNDVASQTTENAPFTINALANDVFGADGVNTSSAASVFVSTQATQGVVTYDTTTHLFTYTPNPGAGSTSTADSFQYTIIDADGDVSVATVNVTLQPDSLPAAADGVAKVDDDGLPAGVGNNDSPGDLDANSGEAPVVNTSEAVWHGQLVAAGGGDTIVDYDFASMHNTNGTVGTETVLYTWNNATSTLTATTVGGTRPGTELFNVVVNQATGSYNLTLVNNVLHADEVANQENDASTSLTFTVTDSDGDPDTGSIVVTFDDDMPVVTSVTDPLNIDNDATPSGTGNFAFDIGADQNADFDDITVSNFAVSVNGVPLDPADFTLTPGAETATTASYTFSFDYDIGSGGTATSTGTLVFNKAAGTYTVTLDAPLEGFSIVQTATGTAFTGYDLGTANETGSQPDVAVTQLRGDPNDPDPATDLFIQFTSIAEPSSGTGTNNLRTIDWDPDPDAPNPSPELPAPGAWTAGELFNQAPSWVSASGNDNGVAGDTIQGGEVLDFTLVKGDNPQGFLAQPEDFAQATTMFLKFDGIGDQEDLIVILKLYDPDTNSYTTRAVMIQNSDIQKGPGTGSGDFSSITLDNNDGLVVIEPNDYNAAGENWVIVGAQIAGSDEGVTGSAINLNSALGAGGGSDVNANLQAFSTDVHDGPAKISSIGFVTEATSDQNATLTFDVTIEDADGDQVTQTGVTVQIGDATAPLAAAVVSQESLSDSSDLSAFSLMASDSPDQQRTMSAANNNSVLLGAIAAAGLGSASVAAARDFGPGGDQMDFGAMAASAGGLRAQGSQIENGDGVGNALASEMLAIADDQSSGGSSSNRSADSADHSLTDGDSAEANAPAALDKGTEAEQSAPAESSLTSASVGMPSAEMLAAANANEQAALEGQAKSNGEVGRVLADALAGGHGPSIDAVIEAVGNHGGSSGGANSALEAIASHGGAAVPAWHMANIAGFPGGHSMPTMETMVIHPDAAPHAA